jgi:hypothetical protein
MSWFACARDLRSNQIAGADYRQFAHQPQPTVLLHTQWLILACPERTVWKTISAHLLFFKLDFKLMFCSLVKLKVVLHAKF